MCHFLWCWFVFWFLSQWRLLRVIAVWGSTNFTRSWSPPPAWNNPRTLSSEIHDTHMEKYHLLWFILAGTLLGACYQDRWLCRRGAQGAPNHTFAKFSWCGVSGAERSRAEPFTGWGSTSQCKSITAGSPRRACPTPSAQPAHQALHRVPKTLHSIIGVSAQWAEIPNINVVSLLPRPSHCFALRGCCVIWQQYNPVLYISALWNILWC